MMDNIGILGGEIAPHLASKRHSLPRMPPACKTQRAPASVGYGIYDLFDLGEFDQKELSALNMALKKTHKGDQTLKANGIEPMADVVLNHKAADYKRALYLSLKWIHNDRTSCQNLSKSERRTSFPGRKDLQWLLNGIGTTSLVRTMMPKNNSRYLSHQRRQ